MKRAFAIALVAAGLFAGGSLQAQAAAVPPDAGLRPERPVLPVQMNSPGDGLTPGGARSGNGRPHRYDHYRHHHRHWHGHHRHGHRSHHRRRHRR